MANNPNSMTTLYRKLQDAGYTRTYIKSLLPEWWDDSIADSDSGYQEASLRLGSLFGVQPSTLRNRDAQPILCVPSGRKFKRQAGHQEQHLDLACALSMTAARLVLKTLPKAPKRAIIPDAKLIRELLLGEHPYVSFPVLLNYVWSLGIPVIFLHHLPAKTKKMAGLAFECDGEPVIVLTSGRTHGFLLFDLAHELAHIALGHVANGRCVVDQEIDAEADDPDERAANRFGLEILTGDPECAIVPRGRNLVGPELAAAAKRHSEANRIDPQHVALNYGHSQKHWGVALAAINLLAAGEPSDQAVLRQKLLAELREHDVDDDDLVALSRLIGECIE